MFEKGQVVICKTSSIWPDRVSVGGSYLIENVLENGMVLQIVDDRGSLLFVPANNFELDPNQSGPLSAFSLGYIHSNAAWYATVAHITTQEVLFGLYAPDGTTRGEAAVRWYPLDNRKDPSPHLEIYSDGLLLLRICPDLFKMLVDLGTHTPEFTPQDFMTILVIAGFRDMTPTERPYK